MTRDALQGVAPGIPLDGQIRRGSVDDWLGNHLEVSALVLVAAGFAVRIFVARGTFLNADEALHYLLINQPSVGLAYQASLTNAHPPLFFLLLYIWHFLGHSELLLRLPSVFAGTALCWVTFKWIGTAFNRTAGLIGLILVAFSPAMIALSAEVRGYALLLFCMVAALYFLERAFQEKTVRGVWFFSFFLYLAILSHYSALFFVLAVGCFSLIRLANSRFPRKVIASWFVGQVGAIAIYLFLYVTHVSTIRNSIAGWGRPFDRAFFRLGQEDLLSLTQYNTSRMFLFLFEEPHVSRAMLWFFVVSVVFLLVRELLPRRGNAGYRHAGILLLLPFVILWGAAISGVYPYVASRHTMFLAPFMIAGASFVLAAVQGQKLVAGLLTATLAMGVSNAWGTPMQPYISKENQSRSLMIAAVNYMEQSVAPGDLILLDQQSGLLIAYYLCDPEKPTPVASWPQRERFTCGEQAIVSLDDVWKLLPTNFPPRFEEIARTYGLKPGDRVWVFQAGWGLNLDTVLLEHVPKFRCLTSKTFGQNIAVIPFVVGPDLLPAAPATHCSS